MAGLTRRQFMKRAVAVGAGLAGLAYLKLPEPSMCDGEAVHDTLLYTAQGDEWYADRDGSVARKEHFALHQAAQVYWAPKELEQELGTCEVVLTLIKLPAEDAMAEWGVTNDGGNTMMMAYHTYKCPHLCCKPVFMEEGVSSLSGGSYETMFLCPCHLSRFDPLSIVEDTDELGRQVMVAELIEGPAPYGLPIVPIIERDGELIGQTDKLEWLKYCGQG